MNSSIIVISAVRFVILLLFQVFILKSISLGWQGNIYMHIIVFPLFIFLLPIRTPRAVVMLLAFALGLAVDVFYDSPGLHAGASVFSAFVRPIVIKLLEPREGYNVNHSPTKARLGFSWFWRYAAIMLLLHLGFYFSMLEFSPVFIADILLKTTFSFIASYAFMLMIVFVFNPLD
ncbi:MAG: hypothetical protein IPN33_13660 [Saprospiraceae bacterium]|nr:hypothetical protein [Saprospiraceae bacterium]